MRKPRASHGSYVPYTLGSWTMLRLLPCIMVIAVCTTLDQLTEVLPIPWLYEAWPVPCNQVDVSYLLCCKLDVSQLMLWLYNVCRVNVKLKTTNNVHAYRLAYLLALYDIWKCTYAPSSTPCENWKSTSRTRSNLIIRVTLSSTKMIKTRLLFGDQILATWTSWTTVIFRGLNNFCRLLQYHRGPQVMFYSLQASVLLPKVLLYCTLKTVLQQGSLCFALSKR